MDDVPTLDQCIAAVKREIAMRLRVYPNRVARGSMTQGRADHEIATMRRVLELLEDLRPGLFHKPRKEEG